MFHRGWLGWVGGDYGHRAAMTRSRNCSLAPIHQFTDCAFTSGGVIPEKGIPPRKRQKYLNRSHPYSIHTIFEFYSIHKIFKFYCKHKCSAANSKPEKRVVHCEETNQPDN